ncbi:MAG: hypothetical protein HFJ49_03165 [Clostridia bacterium]|jgi:hypothetical protein|nr:hypothetical protein [Clostridia bacterium]
MRDKDIIQFLNSLQGKTVNIKSSGYISCQTVINELEYVIKYEIITVKDKQTDNFIVIDLRRIKDIKINRNQISILIFIEDEVETEIVITKIK